MDAAWREKNGTEKSAWGFSLQHRSIGHHIVGGIMSLGFGGMAGAWALGWQAHLSMIEWPHDWRIHCSRLQPTGWFR